MGGKGGKGGKGENSEEQSFAMGNPRSALTVELPWDWKQQRVELHKILEELDRKEAASRANREKRGKGGKGEGGKGEGGKGQGKGQGGKGGKGEGKGGNPPKPPPKMSPPSQPVAGPSSSPAGPSSSPPTSQGVGDGDWPTSTNKKRKLLFSMVNSELKTGKSVEQICADIAKLAKDQGRDNGKGKEGGGKKSGC